ncbi:MAG TPA: DoxX family protein [Terracidiphilus sp.]|nr:DoxX family protein [Terracidiphilus sp.]
MSTTPLQSQSSHPRGDEMAANPQSAARIGDCTQSTAQFAWGSKKRLWAGRILAALAGLFLIFDGVGKLMMPAQVVEAFGRLGFPVSLGPGIGILLLVCTLVYLIPRTAVLGAMLLTGFLGGAVAIQMRAGAALFETLFPVLFAILVWAGIYLRECRLCALVPLRR